MASFSRQGKKLRENLESLLWETECASEMALTRPLTAVSLWFYLPLQSTWTEANRWASEWDPSPYVFLIHLLGAHLPNSLLGKYLCNNSCQQNDCQVLWSTRRLEFEAPLEKDWQVCHNICQAELPISCLPVNPELHLELACVRG